MKSFIKVVVGMGLIGTLLVGCTAAQITNIKKNNITAMDRSNPANIEQVRNAIVRASVGLGWSVDEVNEGVIEATLHLRTHTAVVSIAYDAKTYSIIYKSSENLKFNAKEKTIHKNYNSWVANLDRDIKKQLSLINI